ncbi:MAG: putative immunity protein [Ignavibacteriales bacterium]
MKKLRKMLGKYDDDHMVELMRLIETQSKETIAKWCMDYAENFILPIYKKYFPNDNRPKMALDASRDWFNGLKKLPEVKDVILNSCHQAAREAEDNPAAQAAARTIGQASACFHTPTHSMGLAFYGGAAVAYDKLGLEATDEEYAKVAREEVLKMTEALRKVAVKDEPNKAKLNWHC